MCSDIFVMWPFEKSAAVAEPEASEVDALLAERGALLLQTGRIK
jgi:hypothetical protein